MAIWRDPLDELIAGLERAVPALDTHGHGDATSLRDDFVPLCWYVETLLSRDPDQLRRAEADPHVQRALANLRPSTR